MSEQNTTAVVEVKPLTDWANPPSILQLKQDLQQAKPVHDTQRTKVKGYLDNLNITGSAKIETPEGSSKVQPKLIRKQAEWRYAALSEPFLSTADLFRAKPKTWEDRKAAQQNQLLLNHQFNTAIDKVSFIDEYVRTAVDEGTVIVRVGWEYKDEKYEAEEGVFEFHLNPEFAPLHEELAQMKEKSPSQYMTDVPQELKDAHDVSVENGAPYEPVKVGTKKVTKTRVLKNQPTAEICDINNVVFDPTCGGNVEKARFAVESEEYSLAELEEDGRYKNLAQINIDGESVLAQPDHAPAGDQGNFRFSDKPRKRFVVNTYWGLWDIAGDGVLVSIVAAWVGDLCIRMEMNPFPDKAHPYVVEQYLPVRKAIYGEPDGALLVENQKIVGAVTRGMIDIMAKSANGQTGMSKNMLDATNRRKFDKGQDYEFNPNVDPRVGIHMHTYPEIPQSAQYMLNLQNFEAESMTGVKSFSQGVSGASLGDVAAAVRGALDAASKRELGILRRLSNGIVKVGRKFTAMNAEFLSEEEVVRLTNEEFVTVRRDDLAGKYDLELSISTAEEDNNKAEQLAFLLQTTGNNMDPDMRNMILSDIARLRKMPDMAKKIEEYQPQPDPMMQEKMKLEIELLRAQINKENALAAQAGSTAQLNVAKVDTEGAKAANLSSDTDQKNLDFVEQESGVKQERAKELHGAQSEAQGRLKLLERSIDVEENEKDRRVDLLKEYVRAKAKESKQKAA
jgi:hypothetical protein